MAGLIRTLPTSVFVHIDERNARKQIGEVLQQANQGYEELLQMQDDLGTIPQCLEDVSIEWLDSIISPKVEAIKAMPLPQAAIHTMLSDWQIIREKAAKAVASILSLCAISPKLECVITNGEIICANTEEWITNKATYAIPSKYREHYRLVGNVIEAVNKLHFYESHNGFRSFPIDMLTNSINSVEDYTRFIVDGTFEKEMSKEQFSRAYNYELSRL